MAKTKPPTLEAVANRINAHLQRFAADPEINRVTKYDTTPYYYPSAVRSGRYVVVRYVSYHANSALTRADAERYLAWLDAGNVGKHFQQGRLPLEPEPLKARPEDKCKRCGQVACICDEVGEGE